MPVVPGWWKLNLCTQEIALSCHLSVRFVLCLLVNAWPRLAYAWWVQPHHTVFKTLGMHRAPALRSGPSKCCGLALPDTWSVAWAPKVRECRSSLSTALIRICLVPSHTSPPLQCPRHRTVPPRTEPVNSSGNGCCGADFCRHSL